MVVIFEQLKVIWIFKKLKCPLFVLTKTFATKNQNQEQGLEKTFKLVLLSIFQMNLTS
jgi:hypothetical protein